MEIFNFKKKSNYSIEEIKKKTTEILSNPTIELNINKEELYRASEIQYKAYHYNFDWGYNGIYELLENKYCDKSTALIFYWLNSPLYYLNNPDSENEIHKDGKKLKEYLEGKISENYYNEVLQFIPIDFIEGPMCMFDELKSKEKFLHKIPKDFILPTGMNFNTTGTCGEINKYLKLSKIKTLYCFDLLNTSDVKNIQYYSTLKELNLCFNGYITTKPKYANISDLLHLKNIESLNMDYYVRFKSLDKLIELGKLEELKINVEKENYDIFSSLNNIKSLEFTCSQATDLAIIENMSHLEQLTIAHCSKLIDITGLKKLINLRKIRIVGTKKLKKIDGLFELSLRELIFKDVLISASSLKGLSEMKIELLQIDSKNLKHLDFLPKQSLKELNIYSFNNNTELFEKANSIEPRAFKVIQRNWNNAL